MMRGDRQQAYLQLLHRVIFLVSILMMLWTTTSFAEVPGCTVGDYSEGRWIGLPITYECLIPGPRAPDSPWPTTFESLGVLVSRIEGSYKVNVHTAGGGGSAPKPFPKCITGLVETRASIVKQRLQEGCDNSPYCTCSYTAGNSFVAWECDHFGFTYYNIFLKSCMGMSGDVMGKLNHRNQKTWADQLAQSLCEPTMASTVAPGSL